MLHGRVVRPPAIGATLTSVDESSVRGMPDVCVIRDGNFLGVAAKDEWPAINAGDVASALGNGAKRLKATYDFAIHTHGSIGPSSAIVDIKDRKLTCWTPSQRRIPGTQYSIDRWERGEAHDAGRKIEYCVPGT